MGSSLRSVYSLLLGMGILLMGSGLIGTLLGLRAQSEGFSELAIGMVMSAFFIGYIVGSWLIPTVIARVGHIRTFAALAAVSAVAALAHALWRELQTGAASHTGQRAFAGFGTRTDHSSGL